MPKNSEISITVKYKAHFWAYIKDFEYGFSNRTDASIKTT